MEESWHLNLRPIVESDVEDLRRIRERPEVSKWWDPVEDDFPWEEPESTRLTMEVDGQVAGMIQYYEETEPKFRHAGIDIFMDPDLHGQGIGTEAVRRVARILFEELGHHRVIIDPAADNKAAIRAYEKVGFKANGIARKAERDEDTQGWHDTLMMDLLVEEFDS